MSLQEPVGSAADGGNGRLRLGGGAIASLGGVFLVTFMLQNTEDVRLEFLIWHFTWPLWLLTLASAVIGAVVDGLGVLRRHRRRKERREETDATDLCLTAPPSLLPTGGVRGSAHQTEGDAWHRQRPRRRGSRLGQPGAEREVRRDQPHRAGDAVDDGRRRQRQDAGPAGRARRRRRVGVGLRHRAGRRRPRQRLRQHHRHHPRRVLAGQLRRVLPRHLHRRPAAPGGAARRPLRRVRGVLPRRDLGDVRRPDRGHRRRRDPVDGVRVRRRVVPVRHPHHQADPEAGVRRRRRAWAGSRCSTSSCSSCRSSTGAGSTATASARSASSSRSSRSCSPRSAWCSTSAPSRPACRRARRRSSSGTWPSG